MFFPKKKQQPRNRKFPRRSQSWLKCRLLNKQHQKNDRLERRERKPSAYKQNKKDFYSFCFQMLRANGLNKIKKKSILWAKLLALYFFFGMCVCECLSVDPLSHLLYSHMCDERRTLFYYILLLTYVQNFILFVRILFNQAQALHIFICTCICFKYHHFQLGFAFSFSSSSKHYF